MFLGTWRHEAITFQDLKSGGFQVKHLAYVFPPRIVFSGSYREWKKEEQRHVAVHSARRLK